MNDSEARPDLSLGDPPRRLANRAAGRGNRPVRLLVTLQLLTLAALGFFVTDQPPAAGDASDEQQIRHARSTAIALEDRSLPAESAAAWRDYLRLNPHAEERAEVLYRMGRLLMEAEDFSGAVSSLVEAEQLADSDTQLKSKIGPRIVDCLRRLGHYGEVGRELSRQVEVHADDPDYGEVLATFAGDTLTTADLDRMIERRVDRLLDMQPDRTFRPDRGQLLKQYESADARQQMLHEILQRELFSRRARQLNLDRDDTFVQSRELLETELLASRFLSQELSQIQPTDIDLESYYSAHKSDYRQPESAAVVVLDLAANQSADDVLEQIGAADDFRRLAAQPADTTDVAPLHITRGRVHPRLGNTEPIFELAAGAWTKTPLTAGDKQRLVLVESKTPATTPPLSQIRFRVEIDYRRRKQQELTQRLLQDLMARYDVKILAMPDLKPADESDDVQQGDSNDRKAGDGMGDTHSPDDNSGAEADA